MSEARKRLRAIISAVDRRTGVRHVNLTGAVHTLRGNVTIPRTGGGGVCTQSGILLRNTVKGINAVTGRGDTNVTDAVRALCDSYKEQPPLYSFGALSDLHIQYETGIADFRRALTYLKDRVAFTCVAGDLVAWASKAYMEQYKECVDRYAGSMPVYECAGNHESYPALGVGGTVDADLWTATTGKPLYYSFPHGNDVFVMLGMQSERANDLFPQGGLDWLKNTLEANKNKRCFVFFHAPELSDKTADPSGTWASLMNGTSGRAFVEMIKQHKNIVWFHGHTHVTLGVEQYPVSDMEVMGYRSVHIPSLVSPRFYDAATNTLVDYYFDERGNKIWGSSLSEGYIVDVYANRIVLRGMNFAAGENKDQVDELNGEIYAMDTTFI